MALNREQIRKELKRLKRMSPSELRTEMNDIHTKAYQLGVSHYQEALFIETPPKVRNAVIERADKIRKSWDGIHSVEVKYAEFTLKDIMFEVQREMTRAAGIHGESFANYAEAKEAIAEEISEVWEAAERGDMAHAKTEAIQAIGTLIKFIRTVDHV